MKFSKSLFLAFAGLGLFACSNEDVAGNGGIEGNATVSVTISDIVTRALELPTTGNDNQTFPVEIGNQGASLILEAETGGTTKNLTSLAGDQTIEFGGVRNPKSITLVINGGTDPDVTPLELKNVVGTGLEEPLWAKETAFNQTSEITYTVSIQPKHRLARLQFSGIIHNDNSNPCIYESLKIDGVYLDGAVKQEKSSEKYVIGEDVDVKNVWTTVKGWDAAIFDEITDGDNFLTDGKGWPRQTEGESPENQCYAYNIFPASGADMPKFTVCFSGAATKSGITVTNESGYRFAKVGKYQTTGGTEITEFKAGYIYNITGLSIADGDTGFTPEGGTDATLTATVTVTPWTLVNGKVDWQ